MVKTQEAQMNSMTRMVDFKKKQPVKFSDFTVAFSEDKGGVFDSNSPVHSSFRYLRYTSF